MAEDKAPPSLHSTGPLTQDEVIERLKHAFSYDIIDVDEFESRLEKAAQTHSASVLQSLVSDIPDTPGATPESPPPAEKQPGRKNNSFCFSIMGGITRKGRWKPPRNLNALTIMGGLELDFTKVQLLPGVTNIRIFNLMGGTEIIVPPGVNVDASGLAIMGSFEDHSHQDQDYPGAPVIKIRGVAFMGGIEVRPPKQKLIDRILKKLHLE